MIDGLIKLHRKETTQNEHRAALKLAVRRRAPLQPFLFPA
jgi:hypothetical protein